jgi:hypothetical protein
MLSRSALATLIIAGLAHIANAAPLPLVENDRSAFVIYHEASAPSSVKAAAAELQRVVEIATGVKLPIQQQLATPMIALGDTEAARQAGLDTSKLSYDGYFMRTRGGNLYIAGNDTMGGQEKWARQISRGTEAGVTVFLEEVVGARWLFPGPLGEDISRRDRLVIPETDYACTPRAQFRHLAYVYERTQAVQQWNRHNRLHQPYVVSFPHAWSDYPSLEVRKLHPEIMAMYADGTRQPPSTDEGAKYCLSAPELPKLYAEALDGWFLKDPKRWHGSLSPDDGGAFCQCPQCQAKIVRDDRGKWGNFGELGWSMTPAILEFYRQTAIEVAKVQPDRIVGGLIYYYYIYPPEQVTPLPPNLFLDIAVLDYYGYQLYKPERAKYFPQLLPAWAKFTRNLAWSDYSTWMRDWYGIPLPPGRPILKQLFGAFKDYQWLFINYTGHTDWGAGSLHNYMLSKLMWDPSADVDKVYNEFLTRAYGPEAAKHMDRFWNISEEVLSSYIRSHPGYRKPSYDSNLELVTAYGKRFGEMEAAYSAAMQATTAEVQRQRLAQVGTIMTVLAYNLRHAGLAQSPEKSVFYKSDEDYSKFIAEQKDGILLSPDMKPDKEGKLKLLFVPEKRVLTVPKLLPDVEAPKIDGDLSDLAWDRAALATDFKLAGTRDAAAVQTQVRITYDKTALYLGARMSEPQVAELRKAATLRDDGKLFNDDTIEVFLSHKINWKTNYWHLAFNPAGGLYDNVALEADYNLKFEFQPGIGGDFWTVEIAIPFAAMRVANPPTGQTWKLNFARSRRAAGARDNSTWAIVSEHYHEPEAFGEMKFE